MDDIRRRYISLIGPLCIIFLEATAEKRLEKFAFTCYIPKKSPSTYMLQRFVKMYLYKKKNSFYQSNILEIKLTAWSLTENKF